MELELLQSLGESIALVERLRAQIEAENEAIQHCIHGEVLLYYTRNNLRAMEILNSIKRQLVVFQLEQESLMR